MRLVKPTRDLARHWLHLYISLGIAIGIAVKYLPMIPLEIAAYLSDCIMGGASMAWLWEEYIV